MKQNSIVVVGSAIIDMAMYADHFPRSGESLVCSNMVAHVGGKGSNQAIAASRLGANVWLIAKLGQDDWASQAMKLWQREQIRTEFVTFHPTEMTGMGISFIANNGDNWTLSSLNSNQYLAPRDIEVATDVIARSTVLSVHFNAPPETISYVLSLSKTKNVTTILNASPSQSLDEKILSMVDVLVVNRLEAFEISGYEVEDDRSARIAARALISKGARTVIISLGGRGLVLCDGDYDKSYPAFAVASIDTVGAGDALMAGLSVAIAEGKDLHHAVVFAMAVSSLSVTRKGTWQSMPYRDDVDSFLQRQIDCN